ncbi:hypothetical protein P3T76_005547 [Phytophthora citrophthora]|uniref:Uncharacterized protein n=1 Tax=Phytophthora citrophthora TaxID=4793 RepID=A0AAD9GQQ5_9STRA|nr:hypothetical protein P3T76_005547 [Phytophthora citrophthora]
MMFQQMQELVKLNEAKTRGCNGHGTHPSMGESENTVENNVSSSRSEDHIQRLQTIIVQQAEELETLRRTTANIGLSGSQLEGGQSGLRLLSVKWEEGDAIDSEYGVEAVHSEKHLAAEKYTSQLRKLPLTSLHAQLKGKDLQLLHLQQLINKMENRFGQLIDRKRSMTQAFQQTARTQQAHLKKYLAYIRQQTEEKKALERQLRELKHYVDVLEKKLLARTITSVLRQ